MPPNSDSVPLIASYYFGSMLIISLATAATVLSLNTYKKGDNGKPVPKLIQRIFFDIIAKFLFITIECNRNLIFSVNEAFPNTKYQNFLQKLSKPHFLPGECENKSKEMISSLKENKNFFQLKISILTK